jgi:hypothetical protein
MIELVAPAPAPFVPALANASPKRHLGPAWHRRVNGLHVLRVAGSFHDMGYQHGALLREEVRTGPIPYFRGVVRRLMGQSLGPLSPVAFQAAQHLLGRRLQKRLPPFALETMAGLAEGAGLPLEELLDGCTMPDALLWLAARMMRIRRTAPAVAHRLQLGLGCTSAIAWGDATRDGRLLHARNLDYHGVGNWPSHGAVIFHAPEAGQRYVSVSAAGVALGGVTAMNEAGLSLTVHQHMFTDRAALGGTLIGAIGDEVMRKAESLDDAERILAGNVPVGCWTYLITDARRREVLCFEENPERHASIRTRSTDTTFGRPPPARPARPTTWRAAGPGSLDPAAMAAIIGDRGDARCRIRDSIGMVLTTGSVVFRPEDGTLWVGSGEAPTSRGDFIPFSLTGEDHAPDAGVLTPGAGEPPADREAFQCFRRAYIAYVDDVDPAAAGREMERARQLAPAQALYHFMAGLLALKTGDAPGAEDALGAAIALGHPDEERVAGFHLWRGRARDVQGRRAEAVRDYRHALGLHSDPPVYKAAKKALRSPYPRARAARVHLELSLADVVTP